MFGYIQANAGELKVREYERYRSYYCGLCHTLQKRYGRQAGLLLNYDMTFLAILLSGLYEPARTEEKKRCLPHPVAAHPAIFNEAVTYAADMTILLSYHKAADDRKDNRSFKGAAVAGLLRRDYLKLRRQYPRQAAAVEHAVKRLWKAEEENSHDIDLVAGLTGTFLAEMFVWKEDLWQDLLRDTGFFLGKFVYLMDATEDLEEDRKKGNYNLLASMERSQALAIMQDTMSRSCMAFEKLPIVEDAQILRNILYAGVWVRYAQKDKRERDKCERDKRER